MSCLSTTHCLQRVWQIHTQQNINDNFPFVDFVQTTFVVCAKNLDATGANRKEIFEVASKYDMKLSVPAPSHWTTDIDR